MGATSCDTIQAAACPVNVEPCLHVCKTLAAGAAIPAIPATQWNLAVLTILALMIFRENDVPFVYTVHAISLTP